LNSVTVTVAFHSFFLSGVAKNPLNHWHGTFFFIHLVKLFWQELPPFGTYKKVVSLGYATRRGLNRNGPVPVGIWTYQGGRAAHNALPHKPIRNKLPHEPIRNKKNQLLISIETIPQVFDLSVPIRIGSLFSFQFLRILCHKFVFHFVG